MLLEQHSPRAYIAGIVSQRRPDLATQLQDAEITLNAPDPVPVVSPDKASGLVPLKDEQRSALEAKAETFVAELAALDS